MQKYLSRIYSLTLCLVPITGLIYVAFLLKKLNLKDGSDCLLPAYNFTRFTQDLMRSIVLATTAICNVYLTYTGVQFLLKIL